LLRRSFWAWGSATGWAESVLPATVDKLFEIADMFWAIWAVLDWPPPKTLSIMEKKFFLKLPLERFAD